MLALVALIGTRVDFYAMMYAMWLLGMFALKRTSIARIWNIFTAFNIICIIVQYAMVVGLPPSFCIGTNLNLSDSFILDVRKLILIPCFQNILGTIVRS